MRFAYDELPYEAQPFPQSHPDRLATIATMFGMRPAPVHGCRVLELGCAAGGNLLPMAEQLPESHFLGIDLSARQVAEGRALVDAAGLRNVELRHQSILDFDAAPGAFDYVICHGVYSWVPQEVQRKILAICTRHLAPHGVAFISYNTYPGWHLRGAVREMMLYHVRELPGAAAKVAQARALVEFLAEAVPPGDSAHAAVLRDELERLRPYTDGHLFHEYLEDAIEPVYFHQFAERATAHGLQYLGDADVGTMLTGNLPKPTAETLDRIGGDVVRTEQYMDFVRNRAFRQTLLCRRDVPLQRVLTPARVTTLYVGSAAAPLASAGPSNTFQAPGGLTFTPGHPIVAAAFHHLAETWRQSASFDDLHAAACRRLGVAGDEGTRAILAGDLLVGYTANVVDLRTCVADFVTMPTAKPKASRLARDQARRGQKVTNRRHEVVLLDDFALRLLSLLDGETDRAALLETLVGMASTGALTVEQAGRPISDARTLRTVLAPALDQALTNLARCALLIA